mmetsp:Transcript_11200/g.34568  ORF Transcript_11200/g.34568 Transcript_11200/m.34568 type:complete len:330 (+) Transcript_11200:505-1494(+)
MERLALETAPRMKRLPPGPQHLGVVVQRVLVARRRRLHIRRHTGVDEALHEVVRQRIARHRVTKLEPLFEVAVGQVIALRPAVVLGAQRAYELRQGGVVAAPFRRPNAVEQRLPPVSRGRRRRGHVVAVARVDLLLLLIIVVGRAEGLVARVVVARLGGFGPPLEGLQALRPAPRLAILLRGLDVVVVVVTLRRSASPLSGPLVVSSYRVIVIVAAAPLVLRIVDQLAAEDHADALAALARVPLDVLEPGVVPLAVLKNLTHEAPVLAVRARSRDVHGRALVALVFEQPPVRQSGGVLVAILLERLRRLASFRQQQHDCGRSGLGGRYM